MGVVNELVSLLLGFVGEGVLIDDFLLLRVGVVGYSESDSFGIELCESDLRPENFNSLEDSLIDRTEEGGAMLVFSGDEGGICDYKKQFNTKG